MNRAKRIPWVEVEQKLRDIATDLLGIQSEHFSLESDFRNDLQGDSLDVVEYIMACEDAFNIEVPDEIVSDSKSIADVIRNFVNEYPRTTFEKVDTRLLTFKILPNGHIQVSIQLEDGSWVFADGSGQLPSKLFVVAYGSWVAILRELEELINDPKVTERDLQEFLEAHPHLLTGDDYDRVVPQAVISRGEQTPWRADFVLAPIGQTEFAKVIDLKLPQVSLTVSPKSGHVSFSAKLFRSIEQIRDYGRALDSTEVRDRFRERYGIDVFKPDLQLIIGRKWDLAWIDNIKALRKETQVSIETWDDMIDRIRRRIA
jgi:acyl carrier protein